MKPLLIFLLISVSITTAAQVTVGGSVGYSTRGSFMGNIHIGYQHNDKLLVEYDQRALLDAAQPAYFGIKAAYRLCIGKLEVAPAAGYYFKYQSADDASQNEWLPGAGLMVFISQPVRAEIFYQHNSVQLTIGVWGIFSKR